VLTCACGSVARTSPCTVGTDYAVKLRFCATVGEEPEVELALA
jgi:hypothetical protein